jgi:hypothetical protein
MRLQYTDGSCQSEVAKSFEQTSVERLLVVVAFDNEAVSRLCLSGCEALG